MLGLILVSEVMDLMTNDAVVRLLGIAEHRRLGVGEVVRNPRAKGVARRDSHKQGLSWELPGVAWDVEASAFPELRNRLLSGP